MTQLPRGATWSPGTLLTLDRGRNSDLDSYAAVIQSFLADRSYNRGLGLAGLDMAGGRPWGRLDSVSVRSFARAVALGLFLATRTKEVR